MSVYEHTVTTIEGEPTTLAPFQGKVLLIVNVASRCAFTPQYQGLEALWRKRRDQGLAILGFPCDQFGHQEPGDEGQIQEFCSLTYDVTFPMFSKVEVNGAGTHPLYKELKAAQRGVLGTESIKWNFTKFLVDAQGNVLKRFGPTTTPEQIDAELDTLLG